MNQSAANITQGDVNMLMAYVVTILVVAVLSIIAMWRIFTKAGEKGWKSIIPVYNGYTAYKLFWNTKMFWITFVIGIAAAVVGTLLGDATGVNRSMALLVIYWILIIAAFVLSVIYAHKISKSFGHGAGFTVGLVILGPIFMLILGFGSSQYKKLQD